MKITSTKIALASFIAFWILLPILDFVGIVILDARYVYWRGWEKTVNNYAQSIIYPFKPFSTYSGQYIGDLANFTQVNPDPKEIRHGSMQIDEWGQRNQPHFLDSPVDAVVVGSSYVSGAALDTSELLATILTEKYGLRTYTYYGVLQRVWDDPKFLKSPPKYVIYIGAEGEVISDPSRTSIVEAQIQTAPEAWRSLEEWEKTLDPVYQRDFKRISQEISNKSLIRNTAARIYKFCINIGRTRQQVISSLSSNVVEYDKDTDTLLWQPGYDVPILGSTGKGPNEIAQAIQTQLASQEMFQKRGIELIIVPVPSKSHMTLKKYIDLPDSSVALVSYLEKSKEESLNIVDVYKPMMSESRRNGKRYYFKDDSHWLPEVNHILAKFIFETIQSQSP